MSPEEHHVELSWKIIEAKILYYDPRTLPRRFVEHMMPSDSEFDAMGKEYLALCKSLGKTNTLIHDAPGDNSPGMMEVDWSRQSVQCAYQKLCLKAEKSLDVNLGSK